MKISARYLTEFEEWLKKQGYSENYVKQLIQALTTNRDKKTLSKSFKQRSRAAEFLYRLFLEQRH